MILPKWLLVSCLVLSLVSAFVAFCVVVAHSASPTGYAKTTAYCAGCDHSGRTASGKKLSPKYCAADPKYWNPGTVIRLGAPLNLTVQIEDTGRLVKGKGRFDIFKAGSCKNKSGCYGFSNPTVKYTVIKTSSRRWK